MVGHTDKWASSPLGDKVTMKLVVSTVKIIHQNCRLNKDLIMLLILHNVSCQFFPDLMTNNDNTQPN